jgi:hypothetical protein
VTEGRVSTGQRRLEWVPVGKMRVSPRAQRDHSRPGAQEKITEIAANFDPDKFGTLTVNKRDGHFWVVDGGHRYNALVLIGWEDQQVQCWTYHELTEEQEAALFLDLNDVRPVTALDKFKVAVIAGRDPEVAIDRIVRNLGLTVGGTTQQSLGCVVGLQKVYRMGPGVLEGTLRAVRDAYGRPGFSAKVVEGIGLFVANYDSVYDEERLVSRLSRKLGGVNGLLGRAEQIRSSHGVSMPHAVAAATVETYNQGRGGDKLTGWWTRISQAHSELSAVGA